MRLRSSQARRNSVLDKAPTNQTVNPSTSPHAYGSQEPIDQLQYRSLIQRIEQMEGKIHHVDEYTRKIDDELSSAISSVDNRVTVLSNTVRDELKAITSKLDDSTNTILARLDSMAKTNQRNLPTERPIHIPPFTTALLFADSNGNNFVPYLNRMTGYTHVIRVTTLADIPRKIGLIQCTSSNLQIQLLIYLATTNGVTQGKDPNWFTEQLQAIDVAAKARFTDTPTDIKQYLISPPPRVDSPSMITATNELRNSLRSATMPTGLTYDEAAELHAGEPSDLLDSKGVHLNDAGRAVLADVLYRIIDRNLMRKSFSQNFQQFGAIRMSERKPSRGRGRGNWHGRGYGRGRGRGNGVGARSYDEFG